jgi:hypothetical protein
MSDTDLPLNLNCKLAIKVKTVDFLLYGRNTPFVGLNSCTILNHFYAIYEYTDVHLLGFLKLMG